MDILNTCRFCIYITCSHFIGKVSRENVTIADVYAIGKVVPEKSVLTVPSSLYDEYDFILQGFLVTHFHISIDPFANLKYYLTLKNSAETISEGYKKVDITLLKYNLYLHSEE